MKVFIENESGSDKKNIFNEKTLEYKKTYPVSRKYPYPYGFVLETTSGDGDNLDCFVITDRFLKSGSIVEVEPIGLMKQVENGEQDDKILAVLPGETLEISNTLKATLKDFVEHVFDHLEDRKTLVGDFYGKEEALETLRVLED